jgi:hypothetical protein
MNTSMPPADYLVEVFGSFGSRAEETFTVGRRRFILEPLTTLAKEWMLANVDPEAVIAVDTTAYLFDEDHLLVVVAAMNEHGLVRKGPLPTGLRRHHSSPR